MGKMHEYITPRQLCERTGIDPDTMRARFTKLHRTNPALFPERWRIDSELNEAQEAALLSAGERKGSAPKKETERAATFAADIAMPEQGRPNEVAPQGAEVVDHRKKTDWQMLFFWALCGAIVLGHAGLVWFDCAYLWGIAGKLAGGIVFTVVLASLVLMSGKRFQSVSANMMWFVWLIEACAWFVHWPSFKQEASIGYSKGINDITTQFLAAFICLCAIAATYFYRQTVIEK